MASGQIRMTPDTMRERAGEYRTEADNVQSVIDKMDRLLETLLTEWEGSASEAYANKFAELRPSFVKGKELIDDIAMAFFHISPHLPQLQSLIRLLGLQLLHTFQILYLPTAPVGVPDTFRHQTHYSY